MRLSIFFKYKWRQQATVVLVAPVTVTRKVRCLHILPQLLYILKHHLCVSDNLKARAIINNIKNRALCSAMSFAKEAYFFLSQTISFTNVTRHMEKNGKQNQPTNFLPYPIYTPRDYDQQHVTCIGTF